MCGHTDINEITRYQAKAIVYEGRVGDDWRSLMHSADHFTHRTHSLEDLLRLSHVSLGAATGKLGT
jgi:hypothetical protein